MTTKESILQTLAHLPDDAAVEDAMVLLGKIDRGLSQADAGQTISQEEARRRMARWPEDRTHPPALV